MSNIDKRALREEFRYMQDHYNDPADRKRQEIYIAAEALLDELEHYKSREERVTKLVLDNSTSWDALYKKLEDDRQRIAELERANAAQDDHINQQQVRIDALEETNHELGKAARVNSYWKPDVCPVTGRQFFMWIEHETLGYVPTYGGPFDSYTIPTRDSSGEFSCERYDHDFGGWVGGEFIGLYLIDDDEQCRVCELEERIAELEAREVTLPPTFWYEHDDLSRDVPVLDKRLVKKAIRAAGIGVKGE
ncbi:ead/Ea22-like family protein [Salmonella enterica]|nr:ead/Ea22-like family protein [Salmonella enterica]EDB2182175.1 ead/Ea22-like family protein [Salmonella enterica]EDC3738282.1 ead/Ea22-like family protein [Salmonella enterica]EEC5376775.1 ead/Ea22-like family protein [Salmonella enterica]